MALTTTDLFIVQRGGTQYKMTPSDLITFLNTNQDLTALTYADLQSETFVGGETARVGDNVYVVDASGDSTVGSGWAIYRVTDISTFAFIKINEGEGLDIVINPTNLAYTANPAQGTITNTNGDDVTIPLADGTNAGLASPQMVQDSHVKAYAGGSTSTNPININNTTQEVNLNFDQLAELP